MAFRLRCSMFELDYAVCVGKIKWMICLRAKHITANDIECVYFKVCFSRMQNDDSFFSPKETYATMMKPTWVPLPNSTSNLNPNSPFTFHCFKFKVNSQKIQLKITSFFHSSFHQVLSNLNVKIDHLFPLGGSFSHFIFAVSLSPFLDYGFYLSD